MLPDTDDHNVLPFIPGAITVRIASRDWEVEQARALRRDVFCREQGIFTDDDRDALDTHAIPIVALSWHSGTADHAVGTVRIHHHGDGLWYGSRLAVQRGYRGIAGIGRELIRIAVSSAHARGCTRFLAQVQRPNVRMFQSLHWRVLEDLELHGRSHALMEADLAYYPPCHEGEATVVGIRQGAA